MIVLVDTSVFCNLIRVPGWDQDAELVEAEFKEMSDKGASFMLPLVVFIETGNFIGHLKDGGRRWDYSKILADQVKQAVEGSAPWTPTPLPEARDILGLISDFPESAVQGCGLADHSIIKECVRLRSLFRGRPVRIWTKDAQLAALSEEG